MLCVTDRLRTWAERHRAGPDPAGSEADPQSAPCVLRDSWQSNQVAAMLHRAKSGRHLAALDPRQLPPA